MSKNNDCFIIKPPYLLEHTFSRRADADTTECKTKSGNNVNYKGYTFTVLFCAMKLFSFFFLPRKPWFNKNSYSLDNFPELVENFQLALHHHYNTGGRSLYQPDELKSFCQTHSPHLYDILLSSITRVNGHPT